MQSPWVSYANKIRELFKRDPDIFMTWSDETLDLKMYVDNPKKAEAIRQHLPMTKEFGNNVVKITVIPSNNLNMAAAAEGETLGIECVLEGNPLFSFFRKSQPFINGPTTFIVMKAVIIQYFNDDLGDPYGNANCLPEDLCHDVLINAQGTIIGTERV